LFGVQAQAKKDYQKAKEYYSNSKTLSLKSGDSLTYSRSLLGLGMINKYKKEFSLSLKNLYEAKDIFIKLKKQGLINRVYNEIGGTYTDMADFEGEVRIRNELFNWNLYQKDTLNLAFTAHGIGMLYSYKGYHSQVLAWEEKAMAYFKAIKYDEFVANCLLTIGYAYYNLGYYESAITNYLKSFEIHERLKSKESMANDLSNIGMIYFDMKNWKDALDYYQRCIKLYDEVGNKIWKAASLAAIGQISYSQKNYDDALKYYQEALAIGEQIEHVSGIASYKNNIGSIYQLRGDFTTAIKYYKSALALYQSVIENDGICSSLGSLADVYFSKCDYKKSVEYGEKALELARNANARLKMQSYYELLSKTYSKQGQYKKAYEYQLLSTTLKDSILDYDKTRQIGRIEANFEIKRKLEAEKQQRLEKAKVAQEAKTYKDNLEYFGVILFVIISIFAVFFFRKTKVKVSTLEKYVFIIFLMVFEFVSIVLDAPINSISKGDPLLNLLSAVILAIALTPVHERLKNLILKKLNPTKYYTEILESDV
jgi:tetratricopeptide (TPR) repeat protein